MRGEGPPVLNRPGLNRRPPAYHLARSSLVSRRLHVVSVSGRLRGRAYRDSDATARRDVRVSVVLRRLRKPKGETDRRQYEAEWMNTANPWSGPSGS